jgi:hypothetical protein
MKEDLKERLPSSLVDRLSNEAVESLSKRKSLILTDKEVQELAEEVYNERI